MAVSEYDTDEQVLPLPRFVYNVRTWFNSESDPPPDLELSTTPEERADNRGNDYSVLINLDIPAVPRNLSLFLRLSFNLRASTASLRVL